MAIHLAIESKNADIVKYFLEEDCEYTLSEYSYIRILLSPARLAGGRL